MKKENFISFVLTNSNHILIECDINYVSGIFLVDTGASNSCINYKIASKFDIEFELSNEKSKQKRKQIETKTNEKKHYMYTRIFG